MWCQILCVGIFAYLIHLLHLLLPWLIGATQLSIVTILLNSACRYVSVLRVPSLWLQRWFVDYTRFLEIRKHLWEVSVVVWTVSINARRRLVRIINIWTTIWCIPPNGPSIVIWALAQRSSFLILTASTDYRKYCMNMPGLTVFLYIRRSTSK